MGIGGSVDVTTDVDMQLRPNIAPDEAFIRTTVTGELFPAGMDHPLPHFVPRAVSPAARSMSPASDHNGTPPQPRPILIPQPPDVEERRGGFKRSPSQNSLASMKENSSGKPTLAGKRSSSGNLLRRADSMEQLSTLASQLREEDNAATSRVRSASLHEHQGNTFPLPINNSHFQKYKSIYYTFLYHWLVLILIFNFNFF